MLGQLTNKVVIVTGAARGIGAGIAQVFANAGAKVVLSDIAVEAGRLTAERIAEAGGDALFVESDISERQQVKQLVQSSVDHFGRLDIVVHNAAAFPMGSIEEMPDENLELAISVILKPAFWFTQDVLTHFREQGAGRLIFTSSVTGPTVAMPGTAPYAAAKAGLNGFIKTAALELAKENVTVNGVEPGYIMTDAMAHLGDEEGIQKMTSYIPKGHLGQPDDIANTMLFLASDEAAYITGQTIIVDGGSTLPESPALISD